VAVQILGIPIRKVHKAIATRSVKIEFRCKSCGHTEPAVVQASVKRTSTNRFAIVDMLIDHEAVAQLEAQKDSLGLAQQRAALVSCPQCQQADEQALVRLHKLARKEAIAPTVAATIVIGPMLGAMLALVVYAVSTVEFPDSTIASYLYRPLILGSTALTGWITWRLKTRRLMDEVDEDLAEMQQDVVFRSRDPERYFEIVESGEFTQG
jgi:hypothetical protein